MYSGYAPRQILIETANWNAFFDGCPYRAIPQLPVGTRLIVNIPRDPATGRYGGGSSWEWLAVSNDFARGVIFPRDCESHETQCQLASEVLSLDQLREAAEAAYPGQYYEIPMLTEGLMRMFLREGVLNPGAEVAVDFQFESCDALTPNAVRVDSDQRLLELSYDYEPYIVDIDPAPRCPPAPPRIVPVGRVYDEGQYTLRLYSEDADTVDGFFQEGNVRGEFTLDVAAADPVRFPETPAEGSVQSGIGLIRGWACDATSVHVYFNNLPALELAYGASRPDTISVCGDANNGYGAVFAWGSLGEGTHRMRTIIDGTVVGDVEFEVRGLGEAFVEGLSGEYQLDGFPEAGDAVVVRWSQADQNFVIVDRVEE